MIQVGQLYQTTVKNYDRRLGLVSIGQRFKITKVDKYGDGWSNEVSWNGQVGTWCVLCKEELDEVILLNTHRSII
jgi:hypothetical protein